MEANILQIKILSGVLSISGIERGNKHYYLMGDNSEFLYVLDKNWNLLFKQALFQALEIENGIIPKKLKPDLEAMTALTWKGKKKLLILGSGSKRKIREKAYWLDLEDVGKVKEYDLSKIYASIRELLGLNESQKLNIEGACADKKHIFLLNRGNISGKNALIIYDKKDFVRFLKAKRKKLPEVKIYLYELPKIANTLAGFSGASFVPETAQILFTASVEVTDNEIDDGKVLGSFVGLIDRENPEKLRDISSVQYQHEAFLGKIESITLQKIEANYFKAIAVTDSDGGDSEILEIEIKL